MMMMTLMILACIHATTVLSQHVYDHRPVGCVIEENSASVLAVYSKSSVATCAEACSTWGNDCRAFEFGVDYGAQTSITDPNSLPEWDCKKTTGTFKLTADCSLTNVVQVNSNNNLLIIGIQASLGGRPKIKGGGTFRLFTVTAGGQLGLHHVQLSDGFVASGKKCTDWNSCGRIIGNCWSLYGSCTSNEQRCRFRSSSCYWVDACQSCKTYSCPNKGGAMLVDASSGVVLSDVTYSGNKAECGAENLFNNGGSVTLLAGTPNAGMQGPISSVCTPNILSETVCQAAGYQGCSTGYSLCRSVLSVDECRLKSSNFTRGCAGQFYNTDVYIKKFSHPCGPGIEYDVASSTPTNVLCRSCVQGQTFSQAFEPCRSVQVCKAGYEQTQSPTTSSDRQCAVCSLGKTYTAIPGGPCQATTTCPAGKEVDQEATLSADRKCKSCADGHFKSQQGNHKCISCSIGYTVLEDKTICRDITLPIIWVDPAWSGVFEKDQTFVMPEYNATDTSLGAVSVRIIGSNSTSALGHFEFTIEASDASGNIATQLVKYNVLPPNRPAIVLRCHSQVSVRVFEADFDCVGAQIHDNLDGDLSQLLRISYDRLLNLNLLGTYIVTYEMDGTDSQGLTAEPVTQEIHVIDDVHPELTLLGDRTVFHEAATPYIDAGFLAIDNYDGNITDLIDPFDTVNRNKTLVYHVVDSSGNPTSASRSVVLIDRTAPVISFSGPLFFTHIAGNPPIDLEASAFDTFEGQVAIRVTGDIPWADPLARSRNYTLSIAAEDSSGNQAIPVTVIVNLIDPPPVLTLSPPHSMVFEYGTRFDEPGYQATDSIEGDLTAAVNLSWSGDPINMRSPGRYILTYTVTDKFSQPDVVNRTVEVLPFAPPTHTHVLNLTVTYHFGAVISLQDVEKQLCQSLSNWCFLLHYKPKDGDLYFSVSPSNRSSIFLQPMNLSGAIISVAGRRFVDAMWESATDMRSTTMFPIILVIGDARASFEIVDSPSPSRASAPSNQSVMAFIISGAVAALLFVLIVILFVRRQRLQNKQVTALNSGFQGLPYGNPTLTSGSRTGQHYGINEPNLYDEIYDTTDVDFADTDLDLQLYDNTSNDSPDAVYDTTTEPQQRRETLFERPIYDVPSDGTRQRAATVFEKPAYDMANDGRLLNSAVEPNDYDIASSELFYGDFSAAKPVDESLDFQHPVESQPYYFGKISRKDAESLLREHRARYTDVDTYPAFFLVRDASSGGYALSIIYRSGVVHHTLSASNKGFWQVNNKSTTFTDAVELLSQMQNEVVPPLTRPIGLAIEVMA